MPEEKSLSEMIRENVLKPKSVEVDGQRMEQHSLKDQLEADAYFEAKKAMRRPGGGLKINKLQPAGGA